MTDLTGSISDRLPAPIPTSEITVSETIVIETDTGDPVSTYSLPKAPIVQLRDVTGVVGGVEQTLSVDDDVRAVDANGDGDPDAVQFTNTVPDVGSQVTVEYDIEPIISRYAGAYTEDIGVVDTALDQVIDNKSVETASSQGLELLGTQFGRFGNRAARPDGVYRSFLRSVVPSFSASGTIRDVRFAVSAATGVPERDIAVVEYTDACEIAVIIEPNTTVDAAAELSTIIDETLPPGVVLRNDPIVRNSVVVAGISMPAVTTDKAVGVGRDSLGAISLGSLSGFRSLIDAREIDTIAGVGTPTVTTDQTFGLGGDSLGAISLGSLSGFQAFGF